MLDLLTSGLSVVFAPKMFILIIFAVFLGTLFGALPGVSATMAVTLGIPFTYKMDAVSAIAFLVAIYCASITGGGMTAILFKIPGVPSSAPTTYDGYPMAQRGEAGKALGVQLIASAFFPSTSASNGSCTNGFGKIQFLEMISQSSRGITHALRDRAILIVAA